MLAVMVPLVMLMVGPLPPQVGYKVDCQAALDFTTSVQPVGVFTNMRFTEEHAYGYTIKLWRAHGCIFGLFLASEGLAGDTPTGLLENVIYDPRTGKLSFTAKLTIGLVSMRAHDSMPSRDSYEFHGYLAGKSISGNLSHSTRLTPEFKPEQQKVLLRYSKPEAEGMRSAKTYGKWLEETREVLRLRGPKW